MTNEVNEARYNKILDCISKIISHPHSYTTTHDKHRAIAAINSLSSDDDMVEYLYSQLTQDEHKLVKQIHDFGYDKEITY